MTRTGPVRWILDVLDRHSPLALMLVPLTVTCLAVGDRSNDLRSSVVAALVNLIVVVGLYVFVGNSGIISFGQVGFAAIGGYLSALLTMSPLSKATLLPDLGSPLAEAQVSMGVATVSVALASGLLGYFFAIPLMRLKGISAGIATLSLLVIIQVVVQNSKALSGGGGTLTGIPVDANLRTVLGWALVACVAAWTFQRSNTGLRLRASREDDVAARSLGVRVERERRRSFAVSGAVVAVAGSMYGHSVGSISPAAFFLPLTFLTLAMLVVGGVNSLSGAIVGTVLVSGLTDVIGRLESGSGLGFQLSLRPGMREMVLAALTVVILLFRPEGITGGREPRTISALAARLPRRRTRGQREAAPQPDQVVQSS